MKNDRLTKCKEAFHAFVARHQTGDAVIEENIRLKTRHTALVCANSDQITNALGWPEEERLLAHVIALFHDIGRFPQITRYKTFNDFASCDHAALGVETLLEEHALSIFSPKEQRLILSAVAWHNKRCPPSELPGDEKPFVAVVRDADKLDILRVLTQHYATRFTRPNPVLEFGLPEAPDISEKIAADIMAGRMADLKDIKNVNDLRLIKLSWVFDLSFDISKRLFREERYLEKTLAALPDTPEVSALARHLAEYLARY